MTNPYCEALGIAVPRLAEAVSHPEANLYALLLVALLERGDAMTLEAVAARLSDAGKGPPEAVLRSLKRCRPDRPPVYRHGDLYHLDPFDWELSLWAFRLGLRPPQAWPDRDGATPETPEEASRRIEARHDAAAAERAALRRAVLRAFPAEAPAALVLLDVDTGAVTRFAGADIEAAKARLASYGALAGEEIRPTLMGLGLDVAGLRLHELRPAQKTITTGRRGRVLDVTMEQLLWGSCGIRRKWGQDAPLRKLLAAGKLERLLDSLESQVKDLAALYHYGRLHGHVRLRWRTLDETLPAPWVDRWEDWTIRRYLRRAGAAGQPLEVVAGPAPDLAAPWANAVWCSYFAPEGYWPVLVTADHQLIQIDDVQRLRMARPGAWHAPLPAEAAGPSTAAGPAAPAPDPLILRIRVTLELEREPVWRLIEVPADATFWELHVAIQDAMGWLDYHLHAFRVRDRGERLEIGLPLGDGFIDEPEPLPGWQVPVWRYLNAAQPDCDYEYDFGDSWIHRLRLEATALADPARTYPRCAGGARACPPEDVGGSGGYEQFLEAIADPRHDEHEAYLTWAGGAFDPEAFDPAAVSFDDAGARWVTAFKAPERWATPA